MAQITQTKEFSKKEVEETLNPLVKEWFFSRFADFSLTQRHAVKNIYERKNILISAPTGGTKTLSAFLGILNYLVGLALKKELEDKIYAVYCSPLKALSNDIYVNLQRPLEEMQELAKKKGLEMQEIRVGLRTGDTTAYERSKMAKKCPHIFVTTPESLAIVITTGKFSQKMTALEFIIIDEIHAMTNKRGVHLNLTMERISHMSIIDPVRIGLSATIYPLEEVAKFLVGEQRDCLIADVKLVKSIEIDLDFPGDDILESESMDSQTKLYKMLDDIISANRTTLIFTNTRNATERIIHHLETRYPGKYTGFIGAHHSSMSKEQRFMIEERLRKGELKVVVSSTSLELGIDIGSIDIVILIKSPKGVARALQRIGRAGHQLHEHPRGKFIVLDRDDLVECAILMKAMVEKQIDRVQIPRNALDVLAQQIYGMAITKVWGVQEMKDCIRKAYCYSTLNDEDFMGVISYLAGEYALEHRHVYAKIWYDAEKQQIGKRGMLAKVIYSTNVGSIPDESFISVVVNDAERTGAIVGQIDESFVERMKRGDVFVLGGKKYQFLYTRGMKAFVKADVSRNPTIPSWASEMLPLHFDVACAIGKFRAFVKERLDNKKECIEFIEKYTYCKKYVAEEIYNYFKNQRDFAAVPDEKTLVVEKFKDLKEVMVFHSLYGRRVNDVLSRAYAFAAARLKHRDVELGINDNGFYISAEHLEDKKILDFVKSKDLKLIIKEALEKTDVLKRRFRHCAGRSLMILRSYKGRSKSVGKQQVHSEFLFAAVRKIGDSFPILQEARREVLEDLMDLKNATKVLEAIEDGRIKIKQVRTPIVSPFGLGVWMHGKSDLIKIEDRVAFLKRMHQLHLKAIGEKNEQNRV